MLHNVHGELSNSICKQLVGNKPWENLVRLIYCLQDPTNHRKDLHINVPVLQCIPPRVYYNEIQMNYVLTKIKTNQHFEVENLTIAQTFSMY